MQPHRANFQKVPSTDQASVVLPATGLALQCPTKHMAHCSLCMPWSVHSARGRDIKISPSFSFSCQFLPEQHRFCASRSLADRFPHLPTKATRFHGQISRAQWMGGGWATLGGGWARSCHCALYDTVCPMYGAVYPIHVPVCCVLLLIYITLCAYDTVHLAFEIDSANHYAVRDAALPLALSYLER